MPQPISLQRLTGGAAATFEEPFEMLHACHERVHRMLALLARLRDHLRAHGADDQAQQAARDVMRYFDQAAPNHHQDEELHVFPPLLAHGSAEVQAAVQRLQADHRQMEVAWPKAREVLLRVASGTAYAPHSSDDEALDAFAGLYGEHIEIEEGQVYPAARAGLDEAATQVMGREMMRRRGVG